MYFCRNALFKSFFANGVVTCVHSVRVYFEMSCQWGLKNMKFFDHEPLLLLQSYKTRQKSAHTHSHTCALTVSNTTKLHTNLSKPIIWLLTSEFINFYQIFLIFFRRKTFIIDNFWNPLFSKNGSNFCHHHTPH